jgi:WhiB family redox-sensing transcriptional regulator
MLTFEDHEEFEVWREGAACSDGEIDFFPSPEDSVGIARAKAVCGECPVADDCMAFAIETNQTDGVWGGATAKERSRLRRMWLRDLKQAS